MTSPQTHRPAGDRWLIAALLLAALSELGIREIHHQFASESSRMRNLITLWLAISFASWCGQQLRNEKLRHWLSRALVATSGVAALAAILSPAISASTQFAGDAPWKAGALLLSLFILFCPRQPWARCRPMIASGVLLFVWSQPLLVAIFAPSVQWPGTQMDTVAPSTDRKAATVVFLLDELNAREAPVIEAALVRQGLTVNSKRIESIDRNTIQVIPGLFSHESFGEAKACSPNAVCSKGRMLDFSRVSASRPDIDVVGFFHPYCAINGLRWCRRIALSWNILNVDRWRCALWRRTGWPTALNAPACARAESLPWLELRAHTLAEVRQAPVMSRGGVLYAHLPLPHPPGNSPEGTLAADYLADVTQASEFIEDVVQRLRKSGLSARIVVFSDHPLRQASWCSAYKSVRGAACGNADRLMDTAVPLIVAAEPTVLLPSLTGITRNDQVFPLIQDWPPVTR